MNVPTVSAPAQSSSSLPVVLPTSMRAIVRCEYGGSEVLSLQTIPLPDPRPDEVRVKVHAAGVNQADWLMLNGTPFVVRFMTGLFSPKDAVPGIDLAGVVDAVGSKVTRLKIGDAVFGEASRAYAEYACVPAKRLGIKPNAVSFEQAASLSVAGVAALQGLRDKGGLQAGHRVLINGASGGVGTFAIQIAKALGGEVTAVCSARNVEQAKALGAAEVVDYAEADFAEGDAQYDVIFDLVANRTLAQYRALLAPGGTYVSGAARLGWIAKVGLASIFDKRIKGLAAVQRLEDLDALTEMIVRGEMAPVIVGRVDLAGVLGALERQGDGHARGKTVVVIGEEVLAR